VADDGRARRGDERRLAGPDRWPVDDAAAADAAAGAAHRVVGTTMPVLEIQLQPGQRGISHSASSPG
jgi:hypothetical protein